MKQILAVYAWLAFLTDKKLLNQNTRQNWKLIGLYILTLKLI